MREVNKAAKAVKANIIKSWRDKDLKRLENIIFYSKHNIVFVSPYLALYMNAVHVRTFKYVLYFCTSYLVTMVWSTSGKKRHARDATYIRPTYFMPMCNNSMFPS